MDRAPGSGQGDINQPGFSLDQRVVYIRDTIETLGSGDRSLKIGVQLDVVPLPPFCAVRRGADNLRRLFAHLAFGQTRQHLVLPVFPNHGDQPAKGFAPRLHAEGHDVSPVAEAQELRELRREALFDAFHVFEQPFEIAGATQHGYFHVPCETLEHIGDHSSVAPGQNYTWPHAGEVRLDARCTPNRFFGS